MKFFRDEQINEIDIYFGQASSSFEAAQDFFDISHDEASYLFLSGYYPKNRHKGKTAELYVAKRIRDFVKHKACGDVLVWKNPPQKWCPGTDRYEWRKVNV